MVIILIFKLFNYSDQSKVNVQLLRQLMSEKDNAAKVDDSLGTNHLVVGCDVGQLNFEAGF